MLTQEKLNFLTEPLRKPPIERFHTDFIALGALFTMM